MNISIVSCVFSPEPVISARTSADLAQTLATHGHRVRVITPFPNRPAGELYHGYRRSLWNWDHSTQQYEILRVFTFFSPWSSLSSRFLENISFGIMSALAVLLLDTPDVLYANTWPIFAQILLALACKLRRIPLVVSIQDLYPESLFVQKRGIERSHFLYRFLRWLDVQMAGNCAGLIVISERFRQTYLQDRGIPENKIVLIPNWIDEVQSTDISPNRNIRKQHAVPDDAFLVVYGGNIGVAAGVDGVIEAFSSLKELTNIYLLIAGAGHDLSNCQELIGKYGLERVKIHSPWQVEDTFPMLRAADLCVLPTQGEQSLASVPSKFLSYMMAERPVLVIASPESETARVIREAKAGWIISENRSEVVADMIREIAIIPAAERTRRGEAARSYVLKHYAKTNNVNKVVEILFQYGRSNEQNSSYAVS